MTTSTTGPTVRVGDIVHYKGWLASSPCRAALVTAIAPAGSTTTLTLAVPFEAPPATFGWISVLVDLNSSSYDAWHLLDECRG